MQEMITMAIATHLIVIGATVLFALYNIYASIAIKDEVIYINRMKYLQPQYLIFISAIAFTGIIVMAVNMFILKPSLWLMIVALFIIIYSSIKKHIIRKNSNTNSKKSMQQLREYVKRKYIIDIVILTLVTIVSFAIR